MCHISSPFSCSAQAKENQGVADAIESPEEAPPATPEKEAPAAPINRSMTEMWAMLQSEGRTSQSGVRPV